MELSHVWRYYLWNREFLVDWWTHLDLIRYFLLVNLRLDRQRRIVLLGLREKSGIIGTPACEYIIYKSYWTSLQVQLSNSIDNRCHYNISSCLTSAPLGDVFRSSPQINVPLFSLFLLWRYRSISCSSGERLNPDSPFSCFRSARSKSRSLARSTSSQWGAVLRPFWEHHCELGFFTWTCSCVCLVFDSSPVARSSGDTEGILGDEDLLWKSVALFDARDFFDSRWPKFSSNSRWLLAFDKFSWNSEWLLWG